MVSDVLLNFCHRSTKVWGGGHKYNLFRFQLTFRLDLKVDSPIHILAVAHMLRTSSNQKANYVTLALKAAFHRTTIFLFTNRVGYSSP